MSIQSNINQGLSVASLLVSQTPVYRETAEKRMQAKEKEKLKKNIIEEAEFEQSLKKQMAKITEESNETSADLGIEEAIEVYSAGELELAQRKFDRNPTKEGYEEIQRAQHQVKHGVEEYHQHMLRDAQQEEQNESMLRRKEAERKLQEAQESRRLARQMILTGTPSEHYLQEGK